MYVFNFKRVRDLIEVTGTIRGLKVKPMSQYLQEGASEFSLGGFLKPEHHFL